MANWKALQERFSSIMRTEMSKLNYVPSNLRTEIPSHYFNSQYSDVSLWKIEEELFVFLCSTSLMDSWWALFRLEEVKLVESYLIEGDDDYPGEGKDHPFFHLPEEAKIWYLYSANTFEFLQRRKN